jgi:WhiB family redox-sensing transcriptional regulator
LDVAVYHWSFFPDWHEDAKCRSVEDPDRIFFGEGGDSERHTMTVKQLREIKAYCQSCPVWETCLRHSLTKPERHGIWAGTSKRTRLRILALIEMGETTIEVVISDYKEGRERRYESIRHPQ